MQEIQTKTVMSRYEYAVAKDRNALKNIIKHKMATDIAYAILEKVEVHEERDHNGDTKFTLRFYTTTSRDEADTLNELMPILQRLYFAMTSEK